MHGQGSRKDIIQKETKKFFRIADNEIITYFSQPMRLPVILVALDENQAMFQEISKNKYLQQQGIKADYQAMSLQDLQEAAWKVLEPLYIERTQELVQEFEVAKDNNLGSDDISQIAKATVEGRVRRVLIEADRVYPGKINKETGEITEDKIEHPDIDDVLDDIAVLLYRQNGEVIIISKERIHTITV